MPGYHKINYRAHPIGSIQALAKTLDVGVGLLNRICGNQAAYYHVFLKEVKGKTRTLCDPITELKRIQRRIISRIFCHVDFPAYLHGGLKTADKRDFLTNAHAHSGAEVAIAIDIQSFFPSIDEELVRRAFLSLFHFPSDVATVLTKLCTFEGTVPQGAPTSSYIANLVMFQKEWSLVARLEGQGLTYTRLIDDITVSATRRISVSRVTKTVRDIKRLLSEYKFQSNDKKFRVYSRGNPEELMQITGLWLNRRHPRLLKKTREDIGKEVIELSTKAAESGVRATIQYRNDFTSASGKVALLNRLKHVQAKRLRTILREIPPVCNNAEKAKLSKLISKFCGKALDRSKHGYIKQYYKYQYVLQYVANDDPLLARQLQRQLNKVRPTSTLRELDE